jgi:hypothetical protein
MNVLYSLSMPSRSLAAMLLFSLTFISASDSSAQAEATVKDEPLRTLEAFLGAKTVDELLKHVADRKEVEAEIRNYYPGGKRKPINPARIDLGSEGVIPGGTMKAFIYLVTAAGRSIPVSVEQTRAGFKVEWSAFTQFHDAGLDK